MLNIINPLNDYIVLGQEGVYFKQGSQTTSGNVAANASMPGPYLSGDEEVTIGRNVVIGGGGAVFGDSVKLKCGAVVETVGYIELDNGCGVTILNQTTPISLPVIAHLPMVHVFSAGTTDLFISQGGSMTVYAGNFGLLDANKNSTLVFPGGEYDFEVWNVGQNVDLLFLGAAEIRVAGRLHIDKNSYLGPDASVPELTAADIHIYVLGINGGAGNIGSAPKAVKFGINSEVNTNIYAPNGTLWIGQNTVATGSFIGKWVVIGEGVVLHHLSAW